MEDKKEAAAATTAIKITVTGSGKGCTDTINLLLSKGFCLENVTNTNGQVPFVYQLTKGL